MTKTVQLLLTCNLFTSIITNNQLFSQKHNKQAKAN